MDFRLPPLLKSFRAEGSMKASMRFAARNRKNRVNIGLSALCGDSRKQAATRVREQDIESI
jgi:hypothetical protein